MQKALQQREADSNRKSSDRIYFGAERYHQASREAYFSKHGNSAKPGCYYQWPSAAGAQHDRDGC